MEKGEEKSKLQKYIEELDKFIEKQSYYNNCNGICDGPTVFQKLIMMQHLCI